MAEPAQKRELARKCRALAEAADDRTAASLRMLADDYEAEAAALEARRTPPAPQK